MVIAIRHISTAEMPENLCEIMRCIYNYSITKKRFMETISLMEEKLNIKEKVILFFIIANAIFLIFYQLGSADSYTDGSHYSMRAVGLVDYLVPYQQTAPIQWYEYIPWWSKLSFHDAPPLVFIIQNIFFTILGDNTFAMRLPFALAGIGTLLFVFASAKKMFGKKAAILSSAALSLSTLFTWVSRISYLEGIEVFFITLAFYLFIRALEKDSYFIWFWCALGYATMSKYTSLFLLPFAVIYVWIWRRKEFLNKKFILGTFIFIVIISPVIFYNIMVFKTRGHLDVQLSQLFPSMFEAAQRDWPGLYANRAEHLNFYTRFNNIWPGLKGSFSFPFYMAMLLAIPYSMIKTLFFSKKNEEKCIFFVILCAFAAFSIINPTARYLPVLLPFLAIAIGIFANDMMNIFSKRFIGKIFIGTALFFIFGFEYIYNFDINHAMGFARGEQASFLNIAERNIGYNQLEKFLKTTWENEDFYEKKIRKVSALDEIKLDWKSLDGYNFYLFDFDLDWFARIWYFNRQWIYHKVPFMGDSEYIKELVDSKISPQDSINVLRSLGIKNLFYIVGANSLVYPGDYKPSNERKNFVENFENIFLKYIKNGGDGEVTLIHNDEKKEAFRVLRIRLN